VSTGTEGELQRLRGPVLRAVSRSFYLSIRFLPAQLRDPIALAYLLARATDTIADTHEIGAGLRQQHLATLAAVIQESIDAGALRQLIDSFAPLQRDAAERTLIEHLPSAIAWLDALASADREDIQRVLATINEGQSLDVVRFGAADGVVALQSAAELDRYTYLVAGCVGEFWTRVCLRHVPGFACLSAERMHELGIAYGQGLQLINILRDIGADLRAGRCYLPADELRSLGIDAHQLAQHSAKAEPVLRQWRKRAAEGIAAGIEYACAIRPWRIRFATVLPALIGARTLALLDVAGAEVFERKVKITRAEVRRIVFRTAATLAAPRAIRQQFNSDVAED
jgi:farnesyl-diphosphate farnesyltransferase